jgi:hypothetical protein
MVQLCYSNDFGSLQLCSQFAIRVLALLFAFQLVTQISTCHSYVHSDFDLSCHPCQHVEHLWHVRMCACRCDPEPVLSGFELDFRPNDAHAI